MNAYLGVAIFIVYLLTVFPDVMNGGGVTSDYRHTIFGVTRYWNLLAVYFDCFHLCPIYYYIINL